MTFSLNVSTVLSAIQGGSLLSVLNSALSPTYRITYNTVDESLLTAAAGQEVFSPSGWVSVDRYGDAAVTKGPVEKGRYTSYNKVKQPSELRIIFALEGWTAFSGSLPNLANFSLLSRNNFIQKLDEMKNTASTYNIETPDTVYYSYDLTHFDYFVGSYRGQTLLMANCTFEEIMDGGDRRYQDQRWYRLRWTDRLKPSDGQRRGVVFWRRWPGGFSGRYCWRSSRIRWWWRV